MVPIAYNTRSLLVRKATTAATAGGIALVVFVFASAMMLAQGIRKTLTSSGSEDVAIVIRNGSEAELASGLVVQDIGLIASAAEVRRRPDGTPDAVGEIVAVLAMDKLGTDGVSNVQIRGVPEDVLTFRPSARLVAGRAARPGADEAIIGTAIRGRFRGLDLGQRFEIRKNRTVEVVGIFEDRGSSFESEVWADVETVRTAFGRAGSVSSVRVRLRSVDAFENLRRGLESNRQLGVDVFRETDYYAKQSEGTSMFIQVMGFVIALFFSLGAILGAMVTMYAAVATRSREIGTLRALGFSKRSILAAFVAEALLLALGGGAVGALASMAMGFVHFSIINFASWSEIVFRFEPTPGIVVGALLFAVLMGLVGGLLPAVRAARVDILDALRA